MTDDSAHAWQDSGVCSQVRTCVRVRVSERHYPLDARLCDGHRFDGARHHGMHLIPYCTRMLVSRRRWTTGFGVDWAVGVGASLSMDFALGHQLAWTCQRKCERRPSLNNSPLGTPERYTKLSETLNSHLFSREVLHVFNPLQEAPPVDRDLWTHTLSPLSTYSMVPLGWGSGPAECFLGSGNKKSAAKKAQKEAGNHAAHSTLPCTVSWAGLWYFR